MHSTHTTARVTGASYRQLDYWARSTAARPTRQARGSGSKRGYTTEEVRAVRALVVLARLGAERPVLSAVFTHLVADPTLWEHPVVVTPDGDLHLLTATTLGSGWILDLPGELARTDALLAEHLVGV